MRFDFIVPGIPRTRQTKKARSRKQWQERVRVAALLEWPLDRPPLTQEMSAVVIHYFTEKSDIDVDGIGKLVLDALKGAVIEDDRAISQVILRKSNQVGLLISNPPPVLADALGSHENFVYVQLNEAPNHEELPE